MGHHDHHGKYHIAAGTDGNEKSCILMQQIGPRLKFHFFQSLHFKWKQCKKSFKLQTLVSLPLPKLSKHQVLQEVEGEWQSLTLILTQIMGTNYNATALVPPLASQNLYVYNKLGQLTDLFVTWCGFAALFYVEGLFEAVRNWLVLFIIFPC